jgi:hypothetical protein
MKKLLGLTVLTLALIACGRALPPAFDTTGTWTGTVTVDDGEALSGDFRLVLEQQEHRITGVLQALSHEDQPFADVNGVIHGNEGVLNVAIRRGHHGHQAGSSWRFIGVFTDTTYRGIVVRHDHGGGLEGGDFDGSFNFAR